MQRRVLIYGGRGALGNALTESFSKEKWWICNVDFKPNSNANSNIVIEQKNQTLQLQSVQIKQEVEKILLGEKLDAILCVAGGWAGGNAASTDFIENCDLMMQQSLWSSVISANLAAKHLAENGFLQFTGAKAAMTGTPGMIGYGMAKAAVHHLVQSLKSKKSGLPNGSSVVAILPVTLDTPANRSSMPNADYSSWTPLDFISSLLLDWASNGKNRPASGSLISLVTKEGKTDLIGQTAGIPAI